MTEPGVGFWNVRALGPDGTVRWVAVVRSDLHADGAAVDLPEAEAGAAIGDDGVGWARFGPAGEINRLEVVDAPGRPQLWFAELQEPSARPQATSLIAFTGHGVEPGTLINRVALREVKVTSEDQLGAFRWHPATGFGDQLYVSPTWRRQRVGTRILAAAGTLTFARDWPRLHGDGQRTALGEKMRQGGRWGHLADDLTHLMPPMTPHDERT